MSVETIARTLARWLVRLPASVVHWLLVLWGASVNFSVGRVYLMAAAISYFALLSIFPFLLLALAIFGVVLRDEELQGRVLAEIVAALPIEAPTIAEALNNLAGRGASMGLFALIGTVIAATALARALRGSLNAIFRAEQQRPIVVGWLLDLTVLPVLGLLFITSLLLSTVWRFVEALAGNIGPLEELTLFWELGAFAIPALLSFVGLLLLYLFLPNRPLHVRDVWPGALIAMLGFQIGTFGDLLRELWRLRPRLRLARRHDRLAGVGLRQLADLLFGAEVAAEASRRAN